MQDEITSRWSEIDTLFEAALDLPEAERPAYLDRACSDPKLRSVVERLLESSEDTEAILEPAGALQGPLWDEITSEMVPGEVTCRGGG